MSYKIIYDDLWGLSGTTTQTNQQIREIIELLNQRFQSFISDEELQGESMQSMKTYLQEVHGTFLQSLNLLLAEYDTQLLLYKDGYFNIDSSNHAILPEDTFETIQTELNHAQNQFINQDNSLVSVGRTINDLVSYSFNKGTQINGHFSDYQITIQNLKAKVGEYEKQHEKDLESFTEHLTSLGNLVKYYMGQNKNVPKNYQSYDIAKADGAKDFILSYQNVQTHLSASSQQLEAVLKREEQRIESLRQEAIEARKQQANDQAFKGLLILAGGFIAIVATMGAATPIVATVGVSAGVGTMFYGGSEIAEASDSLVLATKGDITTRAFNPLRDTIFFGNQAAYDFTGNVAIFTSTVTSVFVAPVTNLMASGYSLSQASKVVAFQTVGIGTLSYAGGKLANIGTYHLSKEVFELTESQSQSNAQIAELFGAIATGVAVAKPINKVVTNKFGINTKIPQESMDSSFSQLDTDVETVKLREGIWNQKGTVRGKEIDELMGNNLGSNYPVIDRFEDGVATSIKSRDLTAKTYQNGKTLERTIKQDVDKLKEFDGKTWGRVTIEPNETQKRVLEIVVPNTKLSDVQVQGFNKAIEYANKNGVNIKILVGGN